jgi:hypothetical protein
MKVVFMLCGLSSQEPLNRFRVKVLSKALFVCASVIVLFVKERRSQNYKSGINNRVNASEGVRYAYPCRLASSHLRKCFSPFAILHTVEMVLQSTAVLRRGLFRISTG